MEILIVILMIIAFIRLIASLERKVAKESEQEMGTVLANAMKEQGAEVHDVHKSSLLMSKNGNLYELD